RWGRSSGIRRWRGWGAARWPPGSGSTRCATWAPPARRGGGAGARLACAPGAGGGRPQRSWGRTAAAVGRPGTSGLLRAVDGRLADQVGVAAQDAVVGRRGLVDQLG